MRHEERSEIKIKCKEKEIDYKVEKKISTYLATQNSTNNPAVFVILM